MKTNDVQETIERLQVERKAYGLTCTQEAELIKLKRSLFNGNQK